VKMPASARALPISLILSACRNLICTAGCVQISAARLPRSRSGDGLRSSAELLLIAMTRY
jgi:hypothetical protein